MSRSEPPRVRSVDCETQPARMAGIVAEAEEVARAPDEGYHVEVLGSHERTSNGSWDAFGTDWNSGLATSTSKTGPVGIR